MLLEMCELVTWTIYLAAIVALAASITADYMARWLKVLWAAITLVSAVSIGLLPGVGWSSKAFYLITGLLAFGMVLFLRFRSGAKLRF